MFLTYRRLKYFLPELNEQVITPERIFEVFESLKVECAEIPLSRNGYYAVSDGANYVFLKRAMTALLLHETLAHECVHLLVHYPAAFLLSKHELEAEAFALVAMIPRTDLPRLNRIKHQLDDESYELLKRRNKVSEIWKI